MAQRSNDTPGVESIYPHFSALARQKIARFKEQGLAEYGVVMEGLAGNSFRRVIVGVNGEVRWVAGGKFFQEDRSSQDSPPE